MIFPSTHDFLETFGIEPIDEDPSLAYCRYTKRSLDENLEIDISFSAVSESFQVIFRSGYREVVTISSEKTKSINLWNDNSGKGVKVIFDICNVTSEALVTLEPNLSCHWWTLRNS